MALSQDQREELCRRCRDKRRRKVVFTADAPTVWHPHKTENPETGFCFSEPSAWELIAGLFESGHPFSKLELKKPRGAEAWVTKVEYDNGATIYIKVMPAGSVIFGRSFHIDQPPAGG